MAKVESKREPMLTASIDSKHACMEMFLYYQANPTDAKCEWQGLGIQAMKYDLYTVAIRSFTQHLHQLVCQQFKKFPKHGRTRLFNGKPFAETRYRLALAFMKANLPGLAIDEIGQCEQYIGDYILMAEAGAQLGWWKLVKGRKSKLLEKAMIDKDEASANKHWVESGDMSDKLNIERLKHEGQTVCVEIRNLKRAGGEFKHLEVMPVEFKIPGPISQLPILSYKPICDRITAKLKNVRCIDIENELGLYAMRDFKVGEVVLSEHATLCLPIHPLRCSMCLGAFKITETRICMDCPAPPAELFCSIACLENAQKLYHDHLCGANLHKLVAESRKSVQDFGSYQLIILKAICKATQHPQWPQLGVLDLPEFKHLRAGPPHAVNYETLFPMFQMVARWSNTFGIPTFNFDTYQALFSKISNNCLKFQHKGKTEGIVLGDVTNVIWHNCSPNVGLRVRGNVIQAIALVPIKIGDKLTRSFIPIKTPAKHRADPLSQFGVTCTCKRCVE